jgi:DNA-binding CsgD family transcriptional regulator
MGQILGISQRTVEKHLELACATLGVRTRIQAVVRARELGLLG